MPNQRSPNNKHSFGQKIYFGFKELSIFKVISNSRWASVYALSRVPEVGDLGTAMLVLKSAGSSPIVIFQDLEDNGDTDRTP